MRDVFSSMGLNLTLPTHFGDLLKLVNSKTASVLYIYAAMLFHMSGLWNLNVYVLCC